MRPITLLCVALAFIHVAKGKADYKRVCYYTNWSQYRQGIGRFVPSDIRPQLCTHIIFAFAELRGTSLVEREWNDGQMIKNINALKITNPELKTLIAVGGWNAGSTIFSKMVATAANRQSFVRSAVSFIQQHGLDGLDMDWEYPGSRGGQPGDRWNFVLLLKELREAFDKAHQTSGKRGLLLTAAVPAGKANIDNGYDIPEVARYLDFINLMTYDLHGAWEKVTGENAPMYPRSSEFGAARRLNVEWAAEYWVSQGAPRHKLIIGLPTYGRSFTLQDAGNHGIGAPATGAGKAGTFTREPGFLAYYEICQIEETGMGLKYRDPEQRVPFYVTGRQWVGYDDVTSFQEKLLWIKQEGFGGAMIWSLDSDDFRQVCKSSKRPYPLMSIMYDILTSDVIPVTTTTPKTTTHGQQKTTKQTTQTTMSTKSTTHSGKEFTCSGKPDGFYADPRSCNHFYWCISAIPYRYVCPAGLMYNPATHNCDWPSNVNCKINPPNGGSLLRMLQK